MTESDFTRESGGISAHRAARQILGVALYHSGMLKALGTGRIPIDLVDEHDTLAIESAALHDALLSLHEILNGETLESRCGANGRIPGAQPANDVDTASAPRARTCPFGLPSDVVKLIRSALLIGMSAYGECDKVRNAFDCHKMADESPPEDLYPLHPTGSSTDVAVFTEALRFLDIYDSGELA